MAKVKHIALMKFRDGTGEEAINAVFDQLLDLTETVDGVEDYVSGANISSQGLSHGFTHGFVITFTDLAARDAYLAHSEHQRVQEALSNSIADCAVVDFEV